MKLSPHQIDAIKYLAKGRIDEIYNMRTSEVGVKTANALEKMGLIETERKWHRTTKYGKTKSYVEVSGLLTENGWSLAKTLGVDVKRKIREAQKEAARIAARWLKNRPGHPASPEEAERWEDLVESLEAMKNRLYA